MKKILIIDDEERIAELISFFFLPVGFQSVLKTNAIDAQTFLEMNNVNFIILETKLPGMKELCREISEIWKIPFVIASANNDRDDILNGFTLGADDYICKPFDDDELIQRVANVLKRRGLTRQT
jgi:DNA-binding response OmpR family regulator